MKEISFSSPRHKKNSSTSLILREAQENFNKSCYKKIWVLSFVFLAVIVTLLSRLAHLQLVQGSYYRQLADANRYFHQVVPAERGVFLDRYFQPLVYNKKIYYHNQSDDLYPEKNRVDQHTAMKLMAEEDWQVTYELRRQYLYPQELAHVLGYLAPVEAQELINNRQLKVRDWVGKLGLEQSYDQILRGKDGYQVFEIDTFGKKQRLINEFEPQSGFDIQTSLDPYLSKVAYKAMGEMLGAAIVLDADTGQILSLVSTPSFNSNNLGGTVLNETEEAARQLEVRRYFQDERKPFFNRAIGGVYPPGSVFKMVTSVAGLEVDAFDEYKTVLDEGVLRVNDYEYANWLYTARGATDGEIALVRAIARSNDIYFYKAAEWTGPTNLARQAREFGFGELTNVELSGEAWGLVPDPAWKEEVMGERWFLGNTYHFGIGQGDMAVTPLQVAQMIQTLTKKGELCQPRLVVDDGKNEWSAESCRNLGLDERSIELTVRGMIAACQPGGTGALLFKYNQDYPLALENSNALELLEEGAVGCKTGTSEFGGQDERGRRRTHGWFVANTTVNLDDLERNLEIKIEQMQEGIFEENEVFTLDELQQWLELVKKHGFPKRIALVALTESDDTIPYKEGSREAAPVVDAILRWLK
jgi:penicillin-binding protein 2